MLNKKKKGQGVVEYAGALVIAALIVVAVIAVGPGALTTLFTSITGDIQALLTGQL